LARRRAHTADRGRVDDAAAAGGEKVRDRGAHAVPDAQQVHVDDPSELLGLVVVQAGHAAGARVVERGVEAPHLPCSLVDRRLYGLGVAYVDGERKTVDFGGDGSRRVTVEIEDRDPCALLREAPAGPPTDAGAASCDKCTPAFEHPHGNREGRTVRTRLPRRSLHEKGELALEGAPRNGHTANSAPRERVGRTGVPEPDR